MRAISWADAELVKSYANIRDPAVSYTWATAPAAVGNKGLIVPITDAGPGGYDLFISDGTRLRPIGGVLNLGIRWTQLVVPQLDSNKTDANFVSGFKIRLPYSATNGSLFNNGDVIQFEIVIDRSAAGAITMRRTIYVGSNASTPLSNTLLNETSSSTTNLGLPELGFINRVNSTTLGLAGATGLDAMRGPNPNASYSDANKVTGFPSFDANDTYIDFGPRWNSNTGGAEIGYVNWVRAALYSCGPIVS